MRPQDTADATSAFIEGACDSRIWGMTGRERTTRLIKRLGLANREKLEPSGLGPAGLLVIRADAVLEERLVKALMKRPGALLVVRSATGLAPLAVCTAPSQAGAAASLLATENPSETAIREAGFEPLEAIELGGAYNAALRKSEAPFAFRLTASNAAEIEKVTFAAAYKGVTDFVTKFVWPWPAFQITRLLSRTGITPNMVTFASLIFSVLFFLLVLKGYFLTGIACGWAMALLDTVDGKLARVTLRSSKWGNIFDHGIDLIAPPLWWLAWWLGLPGHEVGLLYWSVWLVLGGHIAGKLVEQAFISTFGLKTHIWRKWDSDFRLITARRNPNLAILMVFTLAGQPAIGYWGVAAWVLLSLAVHGARYFQAFLSRRTGAKIRCWMDP